MSFTSEEKMIEDYFAKYVSNTLAGSANQFYFINEDEKEPAKGRVYYKLFQGGKLEYSLLFSNRIDSTFGDGTISRCNLICDSWTILGLRAGVCSMCDMETPTEPAEFTEILFDKASEREVAPGELFSCDPFVLEAAAGEYLCLEMTFKGRMLPCHEEILVPTFVSEKGAWVPSKKVPVPNMVGCSREVLLRIGFLGDSITQGIGSSPNQYLHWNARLANLLGGEYSYWNLGIGYGRARDAASDGVWLSKAKQMDVIVLCLGVNDLLHDLERQQVKEDLARIIRLLHISGTKVVLQTIPPFFESLTDGARQWLEVNQYIRTELSKSADGFFDVVPFLCRSPEMPYQFKYGGHPNDTGCEVWAEQLAEYMKGFLEIPLF